MNSRKFFGNGRRGGRLLALGVAACGSDDSSQQRRHGSGNGPSLSGEIAGAGSSAQEAAQEAWIAEFENAELRRDDLLRPGRVRRRPRAVHRRRRRLRRQRLGASTEEGELRRRREALQRPAAS